jgi:hypothetical protein
MAKPLLSALVLSSALLSTSTAVASDPIIGVWKLNLGKSRLAAEAGPREQTEVYREVSAATIELLHNSTGTAPPVRC